MKCHASMKDCGPCTNRGDLCPVPVMPPPPWKPFPWKYLVSGIVLFGMFGLLYKYYLFNRKRRKQFETALQWRPRKVFRVPMHVEDIPNETDYLIIGGGTAGVAAVNTIQENDPKAKILIVNYEDARPYMRPPLSKGLWRMPTAPNIENLLFRFYDKVISMYYLGSKAFMDVAKFKALEGVEDGGPALCCLTGWRVIKVDADKRVVFIETREGTIHVYYKNALISTGSRVNILDVFKKAPLDIRRKVTYMHTIRDFEIAYNEMRTAKRVAVIGGGVLGCELASTLSTQYNLCRLDTDEEPAQIHQIFREKGILGNLLPDYLSEWASEKMKLEGVKLYPNSEVHDVYRNDKGEVEVMLSNGTRLPFDFIFVAVGMDPEVDIASLSGLELDPINGGFKVNTEMLARTHLYVAGDCSSHYIPKLDRRFRQQHYDNAVETGCIAGMNMTGQWVPYQKAAHYEYKLGEAIKMEVVGEIGSHKTVIAVFDHHIPPYVPEYQKPAPGEPPCIKDTADFKKQYERGILLYTNEEDVIVGIAFWNYIEFDDRRSVAEEILRAKPKCDQIDKIIEDFRWAAGASEKKVDLNFFQKYPRPVGKVKKCDKPVVVHECELPGRREK